MSDQMRYVIDVLTCFGGAIILCILFGLFLGWIEHKEEQEEEQWHKK